MKLPIKPLSVNKAWQGRRFKSKAYRQYQNDVLMLLGEMTIPEGPLHIHLNFGFSSKLSDFDNPVKPFVDCLQKKYGFNDRMIKSAFIETTEVDKNKEFIEFFIQRHVERNISMKNDVDITLLKSDLLTLYSYVRNSLYSVPSHTESYMCDRMLEVKNNLRKILKDLEKEKGHASSDTKTG